MIQRNYRKVVELSRGLTVEYINRTYSSNQSVIFSTLIVRASLHRIFTTVASARASMSSAWALLPHQCPFPRLASTLVTLQRGFWVCLCKILRAEWKAIQDLQSHHHCVHTPTPVTLLPMYHTHFLPIQLYVQWTRFFCHKQYQKPGRLQNWVPCCT